MALIKVGFSLTAVVASLRPGENSLIYRIKKKENKHFLCTVEEAQGGGGYSLSWPIQGGSARKGYLFQASGIKRVGISQVEVKGHLGI